MSDRIRVSDTDLWLMLLSTTRYALGRRSYITSTVGDLVRAYHAGLTLQQLRQIRDEIRSALEEREIRSETLGDSCDHDGWWQTIRHIDDIIARRETA